MEFCELKYPDAPFLRRELLGEAKIEGYSCLLYKCPDTPHLIIRINGRDFAVKVGSIFRSIIETVEIEPNGNHVGNDIEERGQDNRKSDLVNARDN